MATTAPSDVPVRSLQDILAALERHPEWRTALRHQLLGEELLELPALPALFAKFAAETTRRLDLLTQDLAATNKRLNWVDADVGTLKNDVGILKGARAETKARANIAVIADELDLEYRRIVPGVELRRVARDNGADLRDDEIKSFVASDIMAEAIDAEGNTTYLAVEASYTEGRLRNRWSGRRQHGARIRKAGTPSTADDRTRARTTSRGGMKCPPSHGVASGGSASSVPARRASERRDSSRRPDAAASHLAAA